MVVSNFAHESCQNENAISDTGTQFVRLGSSDL